MVRRKERVLDTETYPKANLKQAWTPDEEADSIVGSYRTPLTAHVACGRISNPFPRAPLKEFTLPLLWQKQAGPFPSSGASERSHQAGQAETICKFQGRVSKSTRFIPLYDYNKTVG